MAQIDSSIYFQQQAPDILGNIQSGLRLADLARQNQIAKTAQAEDLATKNAFRNNVSIGPDGKPSLDQKAVMTDLYQVNPTKALEFDRAQRKNATEDQLSQLEMHSKKADALSKILSGAKDQPSWDSARQQAVSLGLLGEQTAPKEYDPSYVNNVHAQTLSFKDQADLELRKRGLDISQQKVGALKENNNIKRQDHLDTQTDKWAKNLKTDLDPSGPRAGAFGKSQAVVNSAERINGLFQQFPDYNIPKGQSTELATAVAGLINNGSAQSQHQIDAMTPSSLKGDANGIVGWITNNPRGLEQQNFMKLLQETANREHQIATDQIKNVQVQRLSAHEAFKKAAPEQYQQMIEDAGLTTDDLNKYSKSAKKNQAFKQGQSTVTSAASHPQASEAEAWANANPSDPRSAAILKALGK